MLRKTRSVMKNKGPVNGGGSGGKQQRYRLGSENVRWFITKAKERSQFPRMEVVRW